MNESLPDWVKALLHELYHPLGKRRMREAFEPFAQELQKATNAFRALGRVTEGR